MRNDTKAILEAVQKGEMTVEEALLFLKKAPFEDIGYAKVDSHRAIRQGVAEVIFGAGKTAEQMIGIVEQMKKNGQQTILLTIECNPNQGELVNQVIEALEKGEQVPKKNYIEEQVVTQDNVKEILKNRTY